MGGRGGDGETGFELFGLAFGCFLFVEVVQKDANLVIPLLDQHVEPLTLLILLVDLSHCIRIVLYGF